MGGVISLTEALFGISSDIEVQPEITKEFVRMALQFFDVVVSADMTGKKKPEPDSIKLALDRLGVGAEECLMVGDSLNRDIEAGRRLGMRTAYAAYGDRMFKG